MPTYKDHQRGTWYAEFVYTDWDGQRKRKKKRGFKLQREAAAYERMFLEKVAGTPSMSFRSLYDLYMNDCKTRLRPSTWVDKAAMFEKHLLPFFATLPVNEITPATVRKWQNTMINAEYTAKGTGERKSYAPTFLKTLNNQLSAIFNFAMKYYRLPMNPVRLAGSMGKRSARTMQFWTLAEFQQFMTAWPVGSMPYVIFSLLFWSGMRSGELLALTPGDFDQDAGTVSISKTWSPVNGGAFQDPKTEKSRRVIPLPSFIVAMIAGYIARQYGIQKNERIFDTNKSALFRWLRDGAKRTGVKMIRVHDLRHSHASLLINEGFPPLAIRDRLGHENIQTTLQIYSHLYPSNNEKLLSCLEKLGTDSAPKNPPGSTQK